MADVKPFVCVRPNPEVAHRVAALPYDVYKREEARIEANKDPLSFLNIDRPESNLPEDVDLYDPAVYAKAKELLDLRMADGTYLTDGEECYYLYELTMNGRTQTGVVACASIDDYLQNVIRKHENTREEKEQDRIRHVDVCDAQTGPIFLAYREQPAISEIMRKAKERETLYAFTAEDGITHRVWRIADKEEISVIRDTFAKTERIYIADGHHRAASAVKVGIKRREAAGTYSGKEEFNYFLAVLFPEDQLQILPYHRVVRDLNGNTKESFLKRVEERFTVTACEGAEIAPEVKGSFGMYLEDTWYLLKLREEYQPKDDPVAQLDVAILQDNLLGPILGIGDPRTDSRIDFVGGIRGIGELVRRVHTDMKIAFSMYPTSIQELFSVSDAGRLMPPKSTWFEPKLRSGIFIHKLSE